MLTTIGVSRVPEPSGANVKDLPLEEKILRLERSIVLSSWGQSVQSIVTVDVELWSREVGEIILQYADQPCGFQEIYEWICPFPCPIYEFSVCVDPSLPLKKALIFVLHRCKCSLYAFNLLGNLCTMVPTICTSESTTWFHDLQKVDNNLSVFNHGCTARAILYDSLGYRPEEITHRNCRLHNTVFGSDSYILRSRQHVDFYWRRDKRDLRADGAPYFCVRFSPYSCYALQFAEGKLFIFLHDPKEIMWMVSFEISDIENEKKRRTFPSYGKTHNYMGSYTPIPTQLKFSCSVYLGENKWLFGVETWVGTEDRGLYLSDLQTQQTVKVSSRSISRIDRIGKVLVLLSGNMILYLA